MSFPRYPEYKDSGVEWLGEVPAHWKCVALKRVASLRSGDAIDATKISETGDYPVFGGNGLRGYSDAYTHDGFYALIGRQGALCGNINYGDGKFWASEHAVVATPFLPVKTRWLGELMRAMNLNQYSISAAQPGLSVEIISNLRIPLPSEAEQSSIAAFLDQETAKLDVLVAEQEKLIILLKEKRQAVISHAVTKGLDPTVPTRDSGVEWVGEMPEHWETRRIKFVVSEIIDCKNRTPEYFPDGDFAVVRTTNVRSGKFIVDNLLFTDESNWAEWTKRGVPSPGDIIFTREAPAGEACVVPSGLTVCLGQRTLLFRPDFAKSIPEYILLSIYGAAVDGFVKSVSAGSTVSHLRVEQVGDLPILVPPLKEQQSIVTHVADETNRIDSLMAEAMRAVNLLQERRSALISAAVTGQIDVRQYAEVPA